MKRKVYFGLFSLMLITSIIVYVQRGNMNNNVLYFRENLEALTEAEQPSIPLDCSTTSPIIFCGAFCRSCGIMWRVPGISGQYIDGSSTCICGAIL